MADRFYNYPWSPIRHAYYPEVQIQPRSTKSKPVNIPVHFVGSNEATSKQSPAPGTFSTAPKKNLKVPAAITIQKAVRGFLVRKNVRLVRQVAVEVDAIERKISEEDTKVRSDPRERLRVSEELMALLLRLDSVRGVRDFRKKIVGRIIRLQEAVDDISVAENCEISAMDVVDRECSTCETPVVSSLDDDEQILDLEKSEMRIPATAVLPTEKADVFMEDSEIFNRTLDLEVEMNKTERGLEEESRIAVESPKIKIGIENIEDGLRPSSEISKDDEESTFMVGPSEDERGLRQMMERMMVETESLKLMVAKLCETSAEQCRVMGGLAERVNNLERLNHRKDRRKKRRSGAACSALSRQSK